MTANPGGGDYFPKYAPEPGPRPFHPIGGRRQFTTAERVDEGPMQGDANARTIVMEKVLDRAMAYFTTQERAQQVALDWDTLTFTSEPLPRWGGTRSDSVRVWTWKIWQKAA